MTEFSTKMLSDVFEIKFRTDSWDAYHDVQEACRTALDAEKAKHSTNTEKGRHGKI